MEESHFISQSRLSLSTPATPFYSFPERDDFRVGILADVVLILLVYPFYLFYLRTKYKTWEI